MWRCGRNKLLLRVKWSRNDWATVSIEAKARRGKIMKTCTRIGRIVSTVSAVGK